jgi:hypothetical protein
MHQLTEDEQEIQKHINYLLTGNADTIQKAIVFFDVEFFPSYDAKNPALRTWRHKWLMACKEALVRSVPTPDQKIQLLDRYVCTADEQCALLVVTAYLQKCVSEQQKVVEKLLRAKKPDLLDHPMIRDAFPYSLG